MSTGGLELSGKRWNYPENVEIVRKFFWLRQLLGKNLRFEKKFPVVTKQVFNYFFDFRENKPMLEVYGKHWIYPKRVGIIRKNFRPDFPDNSNLL